MPQRRTKRAKIDTASAVEDKHSRFTSWAREQGVEIKGVQAASITGRGVGLIASRRIRRNELLIFVPQRAMIKPLPQHSKDSSMSPQAKLTATLIELHENGSDTLEHCYAVWPTHQDFMSSLWWFSEPAKTIAWEANLPQALHRPASRLRSDLMGDIKAIRRAGSDKTVKLDADDIYLWTIANTRSFSFKPTGNREGVMVICPFLDYMNHCPSGEGCSVKQTKDGYSLVANRDYNAGEEILATYGAHSNDKLLVHYGFLVPGSNDDSVSLDEVILPQLTDRQRQDLENVGFLGNYSMSPQTHELCFRTQVALRSIITTSNEWEFFMNSGDDIAEDKDQDILAALKDMLSSHIKTASNRQTAVFEAACDVGSSSRAKAIHMCLQRWCQIESAFRGLLGQEAPVHLEGLLKRSEEFIQILSRE